MYSVTSGMVHVTKIVSEFQSVNISKKNLLNSMDRQSCLNLKMWLTIYQNVFIVTILIVIATYTTLAYIIVKTAQNDTSYEEASTIKLRRFFKDMTNYSYYE
ncbi:hypothetical protein RF11_06659 [Thelohanellus kitauei]|uniref:Uncharacterized protein n=1 Tax=Thelohanellus kitauei TaxID=669202 RepID=A0A0C2I547_THEKT|nr:hypothetical protein RF11_06659 [Thelohanellus kitauei]